MVAAPHDVRLADAPMPVPGPGEALVRIKAVGLCGSDLQYYAQGRIGDLQFAPGHILGHEAAGVVEGLGRFFGSPPTHGALQEYVAHPAHLLLPLPADIALPVAAVVEALGVAIHAVDLGHPAIGASVAVFGCGPIGLMIARVAQLAGARLVVATEPLAHRRKLAQEFGADLALDPTSEDVVQRIRHSTGGDGVDVAFEAAGSGSATAEAVQVLRPGGTLVLLGYWKADAVTLPGITAMRKGLTVRFVRRMKHAFPRAIDLVRRRQVDLSALVTHEFPLERVAEAFARAEKRSPDIVKAVVLL
jgi:L-iditol 2-dehydrogenase